jgi:cobalamin biosynthesis Mg chelatase CobN
VTDALYEATKDHTDSGSGWTVGTLYQHLRLLIDERSRSAAAAVETAKAAADQANAKTEQAAQKTDASLAVISRDLAVVRAELDLIKGSRSGVAQFYGYLVGVVGLVIAAVALYLRSRP